MESRIRKTRTEIIAYLCNFDGFLDLKSLFTDLAFVYSLCISNTLKRFAYVRAIKVP